MVLRSVVETDVVEYFFSTSIKDTILDEQSCRLIRTEKYKFDKTLTNIDSLYVFEKNDSVFYFNNYHDKFILLYDFTAEVGDTLTFLVAFPNVTESDSFHIIVNDIKTITKNGVPLKQFYVDGLNPTGWHFQYGGGIIVEGIGSLYSIFLPEVAISVALPEPSLGCYQDEKQMLFHFSNATPCIFDIIDSVDDLTEIAAKISISPNPTTGQLHIELDFEKSLSNPISYELFNLNGAAVYKGQTDNTEWDLDLSFLNKGLYLLRISDLEEGSIYKKIVIQ